MPRVFISYRREDSQTFAGRIYDKLVSRFGEGNVFFDIDNIPYGVDFRQYLADAVSRCDVLLALIGEHWVSAEADGRRRLDNPDDFVRLEIESALGRRIRVIPLLLGNASMPREEQLPGPLKPLAYQNGARIDPGRDFHMHMDRVIRDMDSRVEEKRLEAQRQEAERQAQQAAEQRRREETEQRSWQQASLAAQQAPAPLTGLQPPVHPAYAAEIRVFCHSDIFFAWPTWVMAFLFGLLSMWFADPRGTLGVIFIIAALVVFGLSDLSLLWSLLVGAAFTLLSLGLAAGGFWHMLLIETGFLKPAVYFVIGGLFLVVWLFAVFFLDRQKYMIFTPGQLRFREGFGKGETCWDTLGMVIQKGSANFLRHWLLGFGAGDLLVKVGQRQEFRLPNVLFVKLKMRAIENMFQQRLG
jgi:hypothetical protein